MIDDLNKELKTITQKWTRISGGPWLWLRKWGNKNNDDNFFFSIDNHLVAVSNGGGLIATYHKTDSSFTNISKSINIFSPDLHFLHKILLKIQKPPNDEKEWFEFSEVSYIAFTPDELIVVLLNNLTILIFNNIGALINFSVFKHSNNKRSDIFKPQNARLVSYSLAILSSNHTFFYIPDVRKPVWLTSLISDYNQTLVQNFDFIPLNDFNYPLLFYIKGESTICANLGIKSKDIKIPDQKILGISISPDFSSVACLFSNQIETQIDSEQENLFYVLFSDRQFNPSSRKRISITRGKLNSTSNFDALISEFSNFLNFCWCGKSSVIINFVKFCIFVDINGGVCIIENPASRLLIYPEIDGARAICQNDYYPFIKAINNSNNDKNQKKTPKIAFQFGHNFISIVPELLESIFKKKCTDLFQNYIDWTHGSFKDENASNCDTNSLKESIDSFIEASKLITEKNVQQILLGTAWFCQSFLNPMKRIPTDNDKTLAKTFQKVRILHLLREDLEERITNTCDMENPESNEKAFKKMFITYEEMEFLSFPTIISRLCNRGAHVTALVISEIVEEEKSSIFNHKALISIYQTIRSSIKKPRKSSSKKIVEQITKDLINLDYGQLAMAALKFGDKSICLELLEKEKDNKKKMPVLLLLGEVKRAYDIAVENNDQRMINYVAQYAIDHDKIDVVTSLYNKALLPLARFDDYDNKQISLLIFMIRNMKSNALLTYLFSILKKKLLPPDDITFELIKNLAKNNLHHYTDCFTKYVKLLKWINEKGDDQLRSIISNGISTNVRPIVKAQFDLISKISLIDDDNNKSKAVEFNEPVLNANEEINLRQIEEQNEINQQQKQNVNQEQENESDSKSKQNKDQNQAQESEPKSESENQSESKSKSKQKSKSKKKQKSEKEAKQKSKKKSRSKRKAKKGSIDTDSDSDSNSDQESDNDDDDDDSEQEQSMKKDKKKKDKEKGKSKDKKKEKKKSNSKKKTSKKDNKETDNDKKKSKNKNGKKADEKSTSKTEKNDDDTENEKEAKISDDTKKSDEMKASDESKDSDNSKQSDDTKEKDENSDENKSSNSNKKEDEKTDEEDESKKKKKNMPIIKIPFLFRKNQKSKSEKESESKEEIVEEESENEKEVEKIKEVEEEKKPNTEEVDQLQFNYCPKLRNNVSSMKAIEFELCNGRRDEADKLASILELPEPRYIWLLINFYLRTNAQDAELLQLSEKIGLIDGLWVVKRCIVLNRLNIAASFLENISNPDDKKQAKIELQRIITSKQQRVSKVDVKNIL